MSGRGPDATDAAPGMSCDALRDELLRLVEIDEELGKLRATSPASDGEVEVHRRRLESAQALRAVHQRRLCPLGESFAPDAGIVSSLRVSIGFEELLAVALKRQLEEATAHAAARVAEVNAAIERLDQARTRFASACLRHSPIKAAKPRRGRERHRGSPTRTTVAAGRAARPSGHRVRPPRGTVAVRG